MINITESGRAAIAQLLANATLHLAWGRGNASWTPSDYDISALSSVTALTDEIARRRVAIAGFVTPDSSGNVVVEGVNYRTSTAPTRFVHIKVIFEANENASDTIRELGLFINTQVSASLPAGQQYYTPANVTASGTLVGVARLSPPVVRNATVRTAFDWVIEVMG